MKHAVCAALFASLALPAIAAPDSRKNADLTAGYCFQVEVGELAVGTFREVEGLDKNLEVVEYQDGDDLTLRKRPGGVSFGEITLQKSFAANEEIDAWWKAMREGKMERKPLDVRLRDDCTPPPLYSNFPITWSVSGTFERQSSDVLTEEVTLTVEQMDVN